MGQYQTFKQVDKVGFNSKSILILFLDIFMIFIQEKEWVEEIVPKICNRYLEEQTMDHCRVHMDTKDKAILNNSDQVLSSSHNNSNRFSNRIIISFNSLIVVKQ